MKHRNRNKAKTTGESRPNRQLPYVIAVCAAFLLVVGAITVISRERARADVRAKVSPDLVTVNVAGKNLQVDPQTGRIKSLSPQEAQQLAEGLKAMLNRSSEGLASTRHADGSLSLDLKGRFQNVTVARMNDDGSVEQSCVDNPEAAANFFGIDPKLVGVDRPAQPVKRSQANLQ